MLWLLFAASTLIAAAVTQLSIRLSLRRGVLDQPNLRSSHSRPIPRLGGLGILAGTVLPIVAVWLYSRMGHAEATFFSRDARVVLLAGGGMAAIGFCDDLYQLKPAVKFSLQALAALLAIGFGVRFESLPLPVWGPLTPVPLLAVVTVLWLAGFTNIFNFMDGINGLAGGTGAVYAFFFGLLSLRLENRDLTAVAIILAGSSLGFLVYNFPVAKTFMGDTGSLFLGMVLALLVVQNAERSPGLPTLAAFLIASSIYLYDSGFTLLRRLGKRENIFQAHRSHLYQRLVQAGLSHGKVTILYLLLHALAGFLALAYLRGPDMVRACTLGLLILILGGFTLWVYRLERLVANSPR